MKKEMPLNIMNCFKYQFNAVCSNYKINKEKKLVVIMFVSGEYEFIFNSGSIALRK